MIPQGVRDLHERHKRWIPIASFVGGFAFDAVMLHRVDEPMVLIQQAIYLVISAILIRLEYVSLSREIVPPPWLAKPWKYREGFLHFLLGTLLNSYTIFYFKSASALTSFAFIALLAGLLTVNEFKHFGQRQIQVHAALWGLCLLSYFATVSPILFGSIGALPFLAAVGASVGVFQLYRKWVRPTLAARPGLERTHLVLPFALVHVAFIAAYFAHLIPPVPLSTTYIGIFHDVKKSEGEYHLSYSRPAWKFWQHGDQSFAARPGDEIHCFVQVFSPSGFSDRLQVRWYFNDDTGTRGWQPADAIPLVVTGGREEGFRAVTKKANYQPGLWQVSIETSDGRELGSIYFRVTADTETGERVFRRMVR